MVRYFTQSDEFDVRKYPGYDTMVYIGMNKDPNNHIFNISYSGFSFTSSFLADKFKILKIIDEI